MFMVLMFICSGSGCFHIEGDIVMRRDVAECMDYMSVIALSMEKDHPDWSIVSVTCIPEEET